jgi:hypothetical protein
MPNYRPATPLISNNNNIGDTIAHDARWENTNYYPSRHS